jgi:hypothetical protein
MNIKILNWLEPIWEVNEGVVKRTGRGESVGAVIHICMRTTQGNSLCSHLYVKLARMSCFSFHLLSIFFYKIGEQEGRIGRTEGREAESGGREGERK